MTARHVRQRTSPAGSGWGWALLAYLVFVVYGSLVPLDLRPLSLTDALARFAAIGWLDLQAVSRADWVANIVLYVPLTFLGCSWLMGLQPRLQRALPGALVVWLAGLGLALAVEFAQVFFAPRTVSVNDLLAEAIGGSLGVLLWLVGRARLQWMTAAFAAGGRASVTAALAVALAVYLALSLFPYDFVLSGAELSERLTGGRDGWLLGNCPGLLRCLAVAAGELIAIAPIGLLLVLRTPGVSPAALLLAGAGLGLALELLQLLLFSGSSRGLSVLLRAVGLWAGGTLAGLMLRRWTPALLARRLAPWLPLLALAYGLALLGLSGWFAADWLAPAAAYARLGGIDFLPFYYHYFTTETVAVTSVVAQLALYLPVGLAVWVRAEAVSVHRASARAAPLLAIGLALVVEAGKLFVPGQRPDPSNLLIAPVGAALGYLSLLWFARAIDVARGETPTPAPGRPPPAAAHPAVPSPAGDTDGVARTAALFAAELTRGARPDPQLPAPSALAALPAVLPAALVLVALPLYPVGLSWLLPLLLVYAVTLWLRPALALVLLPAALVGLDASPVTGRLLFSELDLVVLITLVVLGVRLSGVRPAHLPVGALPLAVGLLWLTWLVATLRGFGGFSVLAELPRAASHTPLEAWHVGKGLLWALLLVGPLRRLRRWLGSATATGLLIDGLVLGLAWTVLVVLWERHIHVGLFDFDDLFRVTGPFASMHTGGAYIEAWLALAFPVLLLWTARRRAAWARVAGTLLLVLTGYAMLVTFSRAGYGALLLVVLVVGAGLWFGAPVGRSRRAWALPGVAVLVLAVLAIPALSTGFAKQRLGQSAADLGVRVTHWAGAVRMLDGEPLAMLLGAGFGRYPSMALLAPPAGRVPGTYLVLPTDGNGHVLRLGHGESVFLDQWVRVRPDTTYRLSARLRGVDRTELSLAAPLCQKALLYSFTCVWTRLTARSLDGGWVAVAADIHSGAVGRGGHWPHGPVKLSLQNGGPGTLEVDDVRLLGPDGRELLANGGFESGADRWLFVTDQDLAWHIHQQGLEMFFAQGLLGLVAFAVLLLGVARVLWSGFLAGRPEALALAAGLTGFLAVGLLGSTMDAARPMLLFYFAAFSCALLVRGTQGHAPRRRHRPRRPRPAPQISDE